MLHFQYHLAIIAMACVFSSYYCQDNIFAFSRNESVCIGETVTLTCYVYPPAGEDFGSLAELSFNGSTPRPFGFINDPANGLTAIGYSATVDISVIPAMGDSARIQLTISSYQVSDSNTIFAGHGVFDNNGSSILVVQSPGPYIAGTVVVSSSTFSVMSNITQDSRIYSTLFHDVSSVQRPDTLTYSLTLHFNDTIETLSNVPISQINSTAFSNKFLLDTYYNISVSPVNCNGGSGSVDSKTFVLLSLRDCMECIKDISPNSTITQIEWTYEYLMKELGPFEQDYLSKDSFRFLIENYDTNEITNITVFNLNLPEKFDFYLPGNFDKYSGNNILRIFFNGEILASVPIVIEETRSNAVLIILIVILVLLLVLLLIIIGIIISFVIIHFKRKRDSEK